MKRAYILLVFSVLLLATALAACGRDRQEEPTPVPTNTPTAAAPAEVEEPALAPTEAPEQEPAAAIALPTPTPLQETTGPASQAATGASVAATDALSSFRMRGTITTRSTFEDGEEREQSVNFEFAYAKADNVYGFDEYYSMSGASEGGADETMAIYHVGDYITVNSGGEWLTIDREQGTPFAASFRFMLDAPQRLNEYRDQAKVMGVESVAGVEATHYRFDQAEFFRLSQQEMGVDTDVVIEQAQVDVWLANDGNYVVKYETSADLSNAMVFDNAYNEARVDQRIETSMELSDIDGDIVIAAPADAPEPGVAQVPGFAPGEFPLPPNSRLTTNIIGMAELVSDLSQEEVIQFYTDTLAGLGWSLEGAFGVYTATKGDVTVNMAFSTDPATGATKATIFGEE